MGFIHWTKFLSISAFLIEVIIISVIVFLTITNFIEFDQNNLIRWISNIENLYCVIICSLNSLKLNMNLSKKKIMIFFFIKKKNQKFLSGSIKLYAWSPSNHNHFKRSKQTTQKQKNTAKKQKGSQNLVLALASFVLSHFSFNQLKGFGDLVVSNYSPSKACNVIELNACKVLRSSWHPHWIFPRRDWSLKDWISKVKKGERELLIWQDT